MMITDNNMERLLQVNVLLSLLFYFPSDNLPVQSQLEKDRNNIQVSVKYQI